MILGVFLCKVELLSYFLEFSDVLGSVKDRISNVNFSFGINLWLLVVWLFNNLLFLDFWGLLWLRIHKIVNLAHEPNTFGGRDVVSWLSWGLFLLSYSCLCNGGWGTYLDIGTSWVIDGLVGLLGLNCGFSWDIFDRLLWSFNLFDWFLASSNWFGSATKKHIIHIFFEVGSLSISIQSLLFVYRCYLIVILYSESSSNFWHWVFVRSI